MYQYRATVSDIHDGDTLRLFVDLGFGVGVEQMIRLAGLDAPELATTKGKDALKYVRAWIQAHPGPYTLATERDRREKYGRYLGTVTAPDGACLNADLLASGHAALYSGGKRVAA